MCGICGIVDHSGAAIERALVSRMNQVILHRGPDEGGEWFDPSVGLAMRRLAIIDLTSGQQPMFNEDGSIAIVFNGEIYNYHELRDLLQVAGHQFRTQSDTEAIVHLYEQYGPEGLNRLNGMFAIAIWDRKQRQLLLARDRAGKKPLYYAALGNRLAFSSELASLLEHPGISRDLDPVAMDNFFSLGYVPPPHSIFASVKQLEPAHFLLWKDGQFQTRRYWRLEPRRPIAKSESEAAEELLALITDAVRIRLYSDVPFGALLSGGVDSGLVVGLMSRLMNRRVQTFTVGFSEAALDESKYAAEVAQKFGTEHHHMIAQPHSAVELINKFAVHFGEPFGDSSAIPTYLVSEMARKHVTMALSGDGGDEVFGGYPSYRYHATAAAYRNVPSPLRASIRFAASAGNGGGSPLKRRVRRFVNEAELPVRDAWRHSRSIFTDAELAELYTPQFAEAVDPRARGFQIQESFAHFCQSEADADVINHVDYETFLPGDILVKVDRMSMANSLEMRAPLLDYRIAEFAASLPRSWKWTSKDGKKILKRVAASVLPQTALTRPKQGFVAPVSVWLRGELRGFAHDIISSSAARDVIRLDYCERLLARHAKGEPGNTERKLWSILCFLVWHEKYAHQPAPATIGSVA